MLYEQKKNIFRNGKRKYPLYLRVQMCHIMWPFTSICNKYTNGLFDIMKTEAAFAIICPQITKHNLLAYHNIRYMNE